MKQKNIQAIKVLLFLLCLSPALYIGWAAYANKLGANPIQAMQHLAGLWAFRFLLITLAVRPLKEVASLSFLMRFRRMLGLYVFFYLVLHLAVYLVLDQYFNWPAIIKDVIKRPFITVGFAASILLIPLVVTSTDNMMRRLGKRWKSLHQFVYLIGILVGLHFLWSVKADVFEPLIYLAILSLLLLYRLVQYWKKKYAAFGLVNIQRGELVACRRSTL